jgi:uncharacterized tellurite resistance protein B-like protein
MIDTIRSFFRNHVLPAGSREHDVEHRLRVATAALLLEVSYSDMTQNEFELDAIQLAVGRAFGLDAAEANELIDLAEREALEAPGQYEFTRLIKEHFSIEQKINLVEMLWRVAYADGALDKYEEHVIRRISELLYVPHRDYIAVKLKVQGAQAART